MSIATFEVADGSVLSVLEDEDGVRFLSIPDPSTEVPYGVWAEACGLGVAAIVHPLDGYFAYMPTEEVMSQCEEGPEGLRVAAWYRGEGEPSYRSVMAASGDVEATEDHPAPPDLASGGFVHVHTHTEFSALDGYSRCDEVVDAVVADGQTAVAITDHGTCAGHADFAKACEERGVKPIFGMEAYFVDDRHGRDNAKDYSHLCLWAMTEEGLHNLWAMVTESNRTGFHGHPRIDWDLLKKHNVGLLASTGCLRGPVAWQLWREESKWPDFKPSEDRATQALARLWDIFGDRLYLELHTNGLEPQKAINEWLLNAHEATGIPLLLAVDSHYPTPDRKLTHQVWLASQTNGDISEAGMFEGDHDYHLMTQAEARKRMEREFSPEVVSAAIANTQALADRCDHIVLITDPEPPLFHPPSVGTEEERQQADVARLVDICLANWQRRVVDRLPEGHDEAEYMARFEREMGTLIRKGFCGYFLVVADFVTWAKRNNILVGPGRGSGGGCLVAWLMEITELDPIEHGLMFERFLTEGRKSLPDFDIDFPSSKQIVMYDYARERWGQDSVVRIGSHMRLKNKGVVRALFRILADIMDLDYTDSDRIAAIIDAAEANTAGLGMKWPDLWEQHDEELGPYRQKYPELFTLADDMVLRLYAYGQHAAGIVIRTDGSLADRLPLRRADEDAPLVCEFDMHAVENLGHVKYDFLNLRNLDTIQDTIDMALARGKTIRLPYEWTEEYRYPAVWRDISEGHTLGMFQVETSIGTQFCKRVRPQSLADLAAVITIGRPGPMRSGLAERYIRRRDGEEKVTYPHPLLEEALAETYGVPIYQEQIMAICQLLAGYTLEEADGIRRILGKKKVDLIVAEGRTFVTRSVENGIDRHLAESIWKEMEEFAKYGFNKSHAMAYGIIGHWTAFFKSPERKGDITTGEFLTSALSGVKQERVPEFVAEARRLERRITPPDINESGRGFTLSPDETRIRYGLLAIKGVGEKAVAALTEGQPYTSWDDFVERCGVDSGVRYVLAKIGALDAIIPSTRRALIEHLDAEKDGTNARCVFMDESVTDAPNGLPCRYDWANEPIEPRFSEKTGRRLKDKPKPPPKKCWKACRRYTAPEGSQPDAETPEYTDAEIRNIEAEMLDLFLSSTPFDDFDPEVKADLWTAEGIEEHGEHGEYWSLVRIARVKQHKDRNSNMMAFLTLDTERGSMEATVFASGYAGWKNDLRPGAMAIVILNVNDRGATLNGIHPL